MTLYAVVEDLLNPNANSTKDWYENQLLGIYNNKEEAFIHLRESVNKEFSHSNLIQFPGENDMIRFDTDNKDSLLYGYVLVRRIIPVEVNMGNKKLPGQFILHESSQSINDYL